SAITAMSTPSNPSTNVWAANSPTSRATLRSRAIARTPASSSSKTDSARSDEAARAGAGSRTIRSAEPNTAAAVAGKTLPVAVPEHRGERGSHSRRDPAKQAHQPDRPGTALLVREHDHRHAVGPAPDDRERPGQLEPPETWVPEDTCEGEPSLPESIRHSPHRPTIPSTSIALKHELREDSGELRRRVDVSR